MRPLSVGRFGKLENAHASRRVVVLLRGDPDALLPHLEEPLRPRDLVRGRVLVAAVCGRRGRVGRFLERDRLTWVAAGRELPASAGLERRFSHEGDRFSVALTVFSGDEVELHLSAEACAQPEGSVFASAREAAAFLAAEPWTRPDDGRAWEPLAPHTVRWHVPGLADEAQAALELDSAYRQVRRRLIVSREAVLRTALGRARTRPLPSP